MKRFVIKCGSAIATLALMVTTMNVNSTCIYWAHQPELPKGAEVLKKT